MNIQQKAMIAYSAVDLRPRNVASTTSDSVPRTCFTRLARGVYGELLCLGYLLSEVNESFATSGHNPAQLTHRRRFGTVAP